MWLKGALALNVYFSCAAFSMILIYGTKEIISGNLIPIRLYALSTYVIISWFITARYSEEKYWHTLVKLICYSLALVSLIFFMLGLNLIVINFTSDTAQLDITTSIVVMVFSGLSIYGFVKLGDSKWLNT